MGGESTSYLRGNGSGGRIPAMPALTPEFRSQVSM